MTYYYSATTGGFYTEKEHGLAIPGDAVEITQARHTELMDAQSSGARIVSAATGHPRAQFPTVAEYRRRALARLRAEAGRRIREISPEWRQINDSRLPSAEGEARFAAIDAVRSACAKIEAELVNATGPQIREFDPAERAEWPKITKGS
ncbi:hypothetical protein [Qipengyuania flava]|uniref:hypothetical protein n=1 Tax=Qipengyuania flava TaxID=192812 RepID=UPI00273F6CC3|nr:hypothetical protein [Qipengyuania flava]